MKKIKDYLRNKVSPETIHSYHKWESTLSAARFGFPGKKLKVIGVTGTNGKTSVCHYTTQMLEAAGKKVGMVTTVAMTIGEQRELNKSKMTTLNARTLQGYLARMVKEGCEYAVVETTSHALDQGRVHGLAYDVVAMTNLSHEHLDYHKTMEQYRLAKEKLFANFPKVAVVNGDDPTAPHFLKYSAQQKFSYGIVDQLRPKDALPNPDISASLLKQEADKTTFKLTTPHGTIDAEIPLPGRFTVSNVLAAVAIVLSQGVPLELIVKTLKELRPVEGRLEPVAMGQPFTVLVDFAHTPDALQQVYSTIRPMVRGRLIAVLGSMGNRDKTKRPILGALAGRYADLVIVTNEDPVTEDPLTIINEVASGVPRGRPNHDDPEKGENKWWWKVTDRREAIAKALTIAKPNDTVLITGKGGEHVMAIGEKLIPWNDVSVVKEQLGKLKFSKTS